MKGYVRVHITEDTTGSNTERRTQYYVALSDGTHGITDSATYDSATKTMKGGTEADELLRADVKSTGIKYNSVDPDDNIVTAGLSFADKTDTYAGTELHTCVEN